MSMYDVCCTYKFIEQSSHAFLSDANDVFIRGKDYCYSYVKLELDPREWADGGWLFNIVGSDDPLALFVDCKSAKIDSREDMAFTEIPDRSGDVYVMEDLPRKGKQANDLMTVADFAKSKITPRPGSLADALSKGNYLYIYINTGRDETFVVGDNIIHMGKNDSYNFLTFFRSFYFLNRITFDVDNRKK